MDGDVGDAGSQRDTGSETESPDAGKLESLVRHDAFKKSCAMFGPSRRLRTRCIGIIVAVGTKDARDYAGRDC